MVAGAIAGNISAEATTPTGNTFVEAMRGTFEQKFQTLTHRTEALAAGGTAIGTQKAPPEDMSGRPQTGESVFEPTNGYADQNLGVKSNGDCAKASFATRPDTTPKDVDRGLSALASLRDHRAGAAVLGDRIPAEFAAKGTVSVVGQRIGGSEPQRRRDRGQAASP